ncbi:hypothetical protein [Erythrobacter sp.]|uniref:DUF6961 family protein n=1 Tax=Erythrobacter sp. TaxID=1042 RepID=UPI001425D863|nr:hypothetical protein [Erythrobacter sp.]QIQ86372.1 MAG: hypothetical protein G9473_06510 [Erythrobacter sp.]
MVQEWEIWACANHYIKLHGENAAIFAAMRSDELMEEGDLAGAKVFRRIVTAINRLSESPIGSVH